MTKGDSFSKTQVHATSGLTRDSFEILWQTVKAYMRTLPDDSTLIRGPNINEDRFTDNPDFTRGLMDYFTVNRLGEKYWAAECGAELMYPENENEIIEFFRVMVIAIGDGLRCSGKQLVQNRHIQQAAESENGAAKEGEAQAEVHVQTPTHTTTQAQLANNFHFQFVTNEDEIDDKAFEGSLNGGPPEVFLISPLTITFRQFISRFREHWHKDMGTVDTSSLKIRVLIMHASECILCSDDFSSSWNDAMEIAEKHPDSRIQVFVEIGEYVD